MYGPFEVLWNLTRWPSWKRGDTLSTMELNVVDVDCSLGLYALGLRGVAIHP